MTRRYKMKQPRKYTNKKGYKKRIARGKYNRVPRQVLRHEYLSDKDIDDLVNDFGGDNIELTYWSNTGHDLKTDLKNLSFEPSTAYYKGVTLYDLAIWKFNDWQKGNSSSDYIT